MGNFTAMSKQTAQNAFSSNNIGGTISGVAGGIGNIIGTAKNLSEIADTSDIRNQAKAQSNYIPKAQSNEDLLNEWSTRGAFNRVTYNQVRGKTPGEIAGGIFGAIGEGASTGAQVGGPWGALAGAIIGGVASGIGAGVGSSKAREETKELNRLIESAEQQNLNNFVNRASYIDKNNDFSVLYNYAADGGFFNMLKNKKNLSDKVEFGEWFNSIWTGNTSNTTNTTTNTTNTTNTKQHSTNNINSANNVSSTQKSLSDYDLSLPVRLINNSENPDSIGWNADTKTWHQVFKKGIDENNLGMGVDINYLNSEESKLLKKDKNGHVYLTEEDERYLRHKKIKETEASYLARLKHAQDLTKSKNIPSEAKKAVTMSAIYNLGSGNVANVLFEDPELIDALINGTDEEYINLVHQYYDVNSDKVIKPRGTRIKQERKFFNMKSIGGPLNTIFNNGITQINNGDTHENNPHKGVQIGIDNQGIPNLVEEGEVIWNDYVFSNRLKIPKSIQNKYKLKDITFAEAVKKLQKESEERPNDPISKEGLVAILTPLIEEQENIRQKKEMNKIKREFSKGGKLGNLFDDGGEFLKDSKFLGTFGDYSFLGNKPTSKGIDASFLRYAPAIGSAIGATQSLLSKPDYSNVEKLEKVAQGLLNYQEAAYKPLGDFMDYTPFDKSYYTNKLQAESNALRRAISNQGGPSVNASLLAADYNTQTKLGELFRQAEEYNVAQKQKVKEFNRGTKTMNAEMLMKASLANQEAKSKADALYLQGLTNAINMKEALATADATSDSQALSSLFTNLGNIGTDAQNRKDRDFYIKHVVSNLPMDEYINIFGKTDALTEAKRRGLSDEQIKALGL